MENLEKYQPTQEELQLINDKFAKEPYASPEELYVFWSLAADDNIVPDRFMQFDTSALKKFKIDIEEDNVPFMVAHNTGGLFGSGSLPLAQVFKGRLEKDGGATENDGEVTSLYTKKFMQKDLDISGVNTDDFMQAYLGGTIQDVSVGWRTNFYECSICGNDIRSLDCEHIPGQEYKDEETDEKKMCIVLVFHNKAKKRDVQLVEESAVYKGAIRRAKLKGADETPKKFVYVHDASEIKKLSSGVVVEMALGMPILEDFERGKGRGKGGPRQGDGGSARCRCPRCSHTQEHKRGKPCTETRCEKCGAKMVGTNQGGSAMEIDLKKLFAGEYSEKDIKLTDSQVDEVLAVEGDEGLKEKFGDKLNELLVKFPASELALEESDRWTRTFISELPDSSFAVIEPAYTKGETDNKNARHLPCSSSDDNSSGDEKLSLPHLKNALAMVGQIKPVTDGISESELRSKASAYLEKHEDALDSGKGKEVLVKEKAALAKEKKVLEGKITEFEGKVTKLEAEKTTQGNTIESLNSTITKLKKEKETFYKDIKDEILDISVQVKGNDFDKEAKEKEFADVILDKLLTERNELRKERDKLYPAGTHTKGAGNSSKEEPAAVPDSAFKSGKGY